MASYETSALPQPILPHDALEQRRDGDALAGPFRYRPSGKVHIRRRYEWGHRHTPGRSSTVTSPTCAFAIPPQALSACDRKRRCGTPGQASFRSIRHERANPKTTKRQPAPAGSEAGGALGTFLVMRLKPVRPFALERTSHREPVGFIDVGTIRSHRRLREASNLVSHSLGRLPCLSLRQTFSHSPSYARPARLRRAVRLARRGHPGG
jgi:hypothetical protein